MAEWRFLRGWSESELEDRRAALDGLDRNFDQALDEMTVARGWNHYHSEATIADEPPGPPRPGGAFERARVAVESYAFSDPGIVTGHFDPDVPLGRRRMLLELKVAGLRYLCGVVVGAVRSESEDGRTVFGFRYETLEGHIERGAEWFLLTKDHASGAVRFRVSADWLPGEFPNGWSRLGFALFGRRYQRTWHRRAHERLAWIVRQPGTAEPRPAGGHLLASLRGGAAAGAAASVPQAMLGKLEEILFLPRGEDANIAPRLMDRLGRIIGWKPTRRQEWVLGTAYHVLYGAGWGAVYGLAARRFRPQPLLGGALLGALIYGITFPRWGGAVLTGAERPPGSRSRQMTIVDGSVAMSYGLVTALLHDWLLTRRRPSAGGLSPTPGLRREPERGRHR